MLEKPMLSLSPVPWLLPPKLPFQFSLTLPLPEDRSPTPSVPLTLVLGKLQLHVSKLVPVTLQLQRLGSPLATLPVLLPLTLPKLSPLLLPALPPSTPGVLLPF